MSELSVGDHRAFEGRAVSRWVGSLAMLTIAAVAILACTEEQPPPSGTDGGPLPDTTVDGAGVFDLKGLFDSLPPGPSVACRRYLACVAAAEPAIFAEKEALYGVAGSCKDDADAGTTCDGACDVAYGLLEKLHTKIEACGGCDPAKDPRCSVVGAPCLKDENCPTGRCLRYIDYVQVSPRNGYCTKVCAIGKADACPDGSTCGGMPTRAGIFDPLSHPAYCYRLCDLKVLDTCALGYACSQLLLDITGTVGPYACLPEKKS